MIDCPRTSPDKFPLNCIAPSFEALFRFIILIFRCVSLELTPVAGIPFSRPYSSLPWWSWEPEVASLRGAEPGDRTLWYSWLTIWASVMSDVSAIRRFVRLTLTGLQAKEPSWVITWQRPVCARPAGRPCWPGDIRFDRVSSWTRSIDRHRSYPSE